MKVLFVTRKYPPSIGGMETAAHALYTELAELHDVHLVKWGGTRRRFPMVYAWLGVRALMLSWVWRPDVIYLQDGVLAPLGSLLRLLARRPTLITIHGLEVTYPNRIYRLIVLPFIARQTKMVAVSSATHTALAAATRQESAAVILNGVSDVHYMPNLTRSRLAAVLAAEAELTGLELDDRPIIFSTGRLIPRKGLLWFLQEVMPLILEEVPNALCLISGRGEQETAIREAADAAEPAGSVHFLGSVSNELRDALYTSADLFVMPNLRIQNDIEGFGLVATEASSCGTTVVASRVGGIEDAVVDGLNGFLIDPGHAADFASCVVRELESPSLDRRTVREFTLARFSWTEASIRYSELLASLPQPSGRRSVRRWR